jgi:hypothetical protein
LGALIVVLPLELNRLRFAVSHLHAQSSPLRGDAQVAVAQAADQVEGFSRRLLLRQSCSVFRHVLFNRCAHLRRRPKESICRHQSLQRLVRPVEVVRVDEESQPPLHIGEVGKHRPRQKLVPQRLPEALDLAQRLRMLRPALDVMNAFAPQLFFEFRRAPPCRVLPALVRQYLPRRAKRCDSFLQRLHHQPRLLVVRQSVRHQVARVVIHEGGQVNALVASQQKREDVRLPELVRLGALEASHWMLPRPRGWRRLDQPFVVQDPADLTLGNTQSREAGQHVSDAPCPKLRVLLSHFHDRLAPRLLQLRSCQRHRKLRQRHQPIDPALSVACHPVGHRFLRDSEGLCHSRHCLSFFHHLLDRPQSQLHRMGSTHRLRPF